MSELTFRLVSKSAFQSLFVTLLRLCLFFLLLYFPFQGASGQENFPDTRLGTRASQLNTAGRFGKHTEEQGHTLPAVLVPHGMTFWTPQTRNTEKKGVCPYYSTDERLQGFRASHWLVGGCTQDYGSFTLMPLTDRSKLKATERAQKFTDETARSHYYSVRTPNVFSELTATSRTAIFRFTFADSNEAFLAFEVNSDEGLGTVGFDEKNKRIVASNPVHRIYQGKGEYAGMTGYCVVQFQDGDVAEHGIADGVLWVRLAKRQVLVKCANSFVSADGALGNMRSEQPHWDFEETKTHLQTV